MAPTLQRELSPEKIREQLTRTFSSNEFRRAETLRRMLHYIVEQTMAGELAKLKEDFLAVEVFERRRDFDPRDFAAVRVQAIHLRRKLDRYCQGSGALDPIEISVPKRAYVAEFVLRVSK